MGVYASHEKKNASQSDTPLEQHDLPTLLQQYLHSHCENKDCSYESFDEPQEIFDKSSAVNTVTVPQVTLKSLLTEIECLKSENQALLNDKLNVEVENAKLKENLSSYINRIKVLRSKLKRLGCKDLDVSLDEQLMTDEALSDNDNIICKNIHEIYLNKRTLKDNSDVYFHDPKLKRFSFELNPPLVEVDQKNDNERRNLFDRLDESNKPESLINHTESDHLYDGTETSDDNSVTGILAGNT
ncbi:unnamed protein product [Clavelina lepadiformis]|uniref:Uncharacterized protein n=1 Tax=Clavelina lepadiformis TaxID=159417 RepID=A0ABP0GAA1_CLALP